MFETLRIKLQFISDMTKFETDNSIYAYLIRYVFREREREYPFFEKERTRKRSFFDY